MTATTDTEYTPHKLVICDAEGRVDEIAKLTALDMFTAEHLLPGFSLACQLMKAASEATDGPGDVETRIGDWALGFEKQTAACLRLLGYRPNTEEEVAGIMGMLLGGDVHGTESVAVVRERYQWQPPAFDVLTLAVTCRMATGWFYRHSDDIQEAWDGSLRKSVAGLAVTVAEAHRRLFLRINDDQLDLCEDRSSPLGYRIVRRDGLLMS